MSAIPKLSVIDESGWQPGGRAKGLGGTDIAAILGLHPYRTPFDVFASKVGILKDEELEESAPMHWGNVLEPVILGEYERLTGIKATPWGRVMLRSVERPWEQGTPDAANEEQRRVIEAKNVGTRQAKRWGEEGTDAAPEEYVIQVAWYMGLTGFERADIACLIGGNDFRIYPVQRDLELEAMLHEEAERFWKSHVLADVPPAPIGRSVERFLRARFPMQREPLRQATAEEADLLRTWKSKRELLESLDLEVERLGNSLRLSIGDAEGLESSEVAVTWKKSKDSERVDYPAVLKDLVAAMPGSEPLVKEIVNVRTEVRPGARRLLERKSK